MNKVAQQCSPSRQVVAAISLLLISVVFYLYFLNMSVVHVVMRKEAVQSENELRAEIAQLETKYIEAQHEIASRISTLEGYREEAPKIFVSRAQTETLVKAN